MRVRALDASGDCTFGRSAANFLVNSPAAVGQTVMTRLMLWEGDWFLDVTEGTPWSTEILGANTKPLYDLAIQQRILETNDVTAITQYSSTVSGRSLIVTATIDTTFGTTTVQVTL